MLEDKNHKLNYAWPVTTMAKYDYDALKMCVGGNEKIFREKPIAIFGAGIRGTMFSKILEMWGYTDMVFCDNNEDKLGGGSTTTRSYRPVKLHPGSMSSLFP